MSFGQDLEIVCQNLILEITQIILKIPKVLNKEQMENMLIRKKME